MPIQGLTRLRFMQLAKQTVIGTAVTATRRVPWRGIITYDPTRVDPDVDVGSIDPVISPYPTASEVGLAATGPLTFDDGPIRLAAGLKGGVSATGGGTAKTWLYQVASLTADDFDYWTIETGDDTATDTKIGKGGVIDVLEETLPEDGGPWTISDTWVFADAALGSASSGAIAVDDTPVFVFGTDTQIKVDVLAANIGITPLIDAVHSAVIRVTNNLDKKRFANGSNSRFALSGYGRGARMIEVILTLAKTTATIAEANTLDDSPVPNRFIEVSTTSTELAQAANPFAYRRRGAFRLFSRAEGEMGGNATIVLTYRAYYDATLGYAYQARLVCQLATLP